MEIPFQGPFPPIPAPSSIPRDPQFPGNSLPGSSFSNKNLGNSRAAPKSMENPIPEAIPGSFRISQSSRGSGLVCTGFPLPMDWESLDFCSSQRWQKQELLERKKPRNLMGKRSHFFFPGIQHFLMLNHSRIIPEADPGPQRDSRLRIPGLILTLFLLFQPGLGSGMKSNSSGIPALEGAAGTTPNPGFPIKFHGGKVRSSPAHPKHVFNPKLGKKNPGKGQDSKQGCSQKK